MTSKQLEHLLEHLLEYARWLKDAFDEPLDLQFVDDVLVSLAVVLAVVRAEEAK